MPRESEITWSCGDVRRTYKVVYADDPPERRDAVEFFKGHALTLFPALSTYIPEQVHRMPLDRANAYLRQHPITESWQQLQIGHQDQIQDQDLERLRHLPEITHVDIFSSNITDAGVRRMLALPRLEWLVLYSTRVTDRCLDDIRLMKGLKLLDLQRASGVSRPAFDATVAALPQLHDVYPPRHGGPGAEL